MWEVCVRLCARVHVSLLQSIPGGLLSKSQQRSLIVGEDTHPALTPEVTGGLYDGDTQEGQIIE